MDIIVTLPRKEQKLTELEDIYAKSINSVQFWKLGKKPQLLNIGDKVYFVVNNKVVYYHIFLGFVYDPVCEVTGRVWRGLNLYLKYPEVNLKVPYTMKGFRGFKYVPEGLRLE